MKVWFSRSLLLVLLPTLLHAATHRVEVGSYYFSPQTLQIAVGDTVIWEAVNGHHNVAGPGFRSEVRSAPWTFTCTFTNEARLPYVCEPHASRFMNGVITVVYPKHPSLELDGPASGSTVAHTDSVRFTAQSLAYWWIPSRVEFFDGTNSVFLDGIPPFELLSEFSEGSHSITAIGSDGSLMATSAPIAFSVVVTNLPPTIAISPFPTNTMLFNPVAFRVNASDPDTPVARVDYFLDGHPLGSSTNSPFTLTNQFLPLGYHRIEAVAQDSYGLSSSPGSAILEFNVYGRPTLKITSSQNGVGDVSFDSGNGWIFLEQSSDLSFSTVTTIGPVSPGGGGSVYRELPFNQGAGFFRLRIDPFQ